MGLDMYLQAEKYLGNYPFMREQGDGHYDKEISQHEAVLEAIGLPLDGACKESPSLTVSVTVAYWRKVNAIHQWFVDNCANGTDDCKQAYVSTEKLKELQAVCEELLKNKDAAEAQSLLPPQEGFFFGNNDIDEWYWRGLGDTVEQIKDVFARFPSDEWTIYYRASWCEGGDTWTR